MDDGEKEQLSLRWFLLLMRMISCLLGSDKNWANATSVVAVVVPLSCFIQLLVMKKQRGFGAYNNNNNHTANACDHHNNNEEHKVEGSCPTRRTDSCRGRGVIFFAPLTTSRAFFARFESEI
jgi:hypothetical protein